MGACRGRKEVALKLNPVEPHIRYLLLMETEDQLKGGSANAEPVIEQQLRHLQRRELLLCFIYDKSTIGLSDITHVIICVQKCVLHILHLKYILFVTLKRFYSYILYGAKTCRRLYSEKVLSPSDCSGLSAAINLKHLFLTFNTEYIKME